VALPLAPEIRCHFVKKGERHMIPLRWLCAPLLAVPFVLTGCNKGPDTPKDKLYDVKGKVVTVDPGKKTVTLDHEDIPGLMKAMEMKFSVEDAKVLEGINTGDQVHGRLKVESGNYIITELKKH
jgi:protein SCO1/2